MSIAGLEHNLEPQPCVVTEAKASTKISRDNRKTKQSRHRAANPPQNDTESITTLLESLAVTEPSAMAQPIRVLVCSIGNPGKYMGTLHSAGHTVLNALLPLLSSNGSFAKSRSYASGIVSSGPIYTLWQSPTLMNVSGPAVSAAWRTFLRENHNDPNTRLVVVHDELEIALGAVKVRKGDASPKGHNGLKSIKQTMPGMDYTRIGVGIGRPESRDANDVAAYVLRKMSPMEKIKIEGSVGVVRAELKRLAGV
jgi:PTH1 family peptidyl-tRNA hydrolase